MQFLIFADEVLLKIKKIFGKYGFLVVFNLEKKKLTNTKYKQENTNRDFKNFILYKTTRIKKTTHQKSKFIHL